MCSRRCPRSPDGSPPVRRMTMWRFHSAATPAFCSAVVTRPAIVPDIVIADHRDDAVARHAARRKSRCRPMISWFSAGVRRTDRRVTVHIVAKQHDEFGPQRVDALHDAPHPRRDRRADRRHGCRSMRGDGQRRAVPLVAHHLDAAHDKRLRLDEPSIDVEPVGRPGTATSATAAPSGCARLTCPTAGTANARQHSQRQHDDAPMAAAAFVKNLASAAH